MKSSTSFGTKVLNIVTGIAFLACLVAVASLFRNEFWPAPASAAVPAHIAKWREYAVSTERVGPAVAAVTIVEWSDFQCPFCRRAVFGIDSLMAMHPGAITLLHRNFPIQSHQFSMALSRGGICAARQNRFGEYYHAVFLAQDSVKSISVDSFAERAHVPDGKTFRECLLDPAVDTTIAKDRAAGDSMKVTGTPTFLINDTRIVGYAGVPALDSLIANMLHASKK